MEDELAHGGAASVVEPHETEQVAEDAQLADDAIARLLLYVVRHGNVYPNAVADALAVANVIGVPFSIEALEALAAAGIRA